MRCEVTDCTFCTVAMSGLVDLLRRIGIPETAAQAYTTTLAHDGFDSPLAFEEVTIEELEAKLATQIAIHQEKERLLNAHVRDSKHKDELLKGAMTELGKGKVQRDARQALCKATSFLTNRLLELTEQVDGLQRDEYDY